MHTTCGVGSSEFDGRFGLNIGVAFNALAIMARGMIDGSCTVGDNVTHTYADVAISLRETFRWVLASHVRHRITTVHVSAVEFSQHPERNYSELSAQIYPELRELRLRGIAVVAPAGNSCLKGSPFCHAPFISRPMYCPSSGFQSVANDFPSSIIKSQ